MKITKEKCFFTEIHPYLITAAVIVISYAFFALVLGTGEGLVRALMLGGVALCGAYLFVQRLRKKTFDAESVILAVIIAGMVMRIGYMLYTPFTVRDYDIGTSDGTGHFGYMVRLFSEAALPDSMDYQFYHPPFQHIVQALVVKVFSWFQPGAELTSLFEAAKIVPCFASCALLWVCRSLCREVGLSGRASAVALSILAFHPAFYQLSSRVNNDALMLLFFMVSVLYTIRWYYRPSMKNILLIALAIGLSMMTKLSGGLAALFTAPVFLAVLAKRWCGKHAKGLASQFVAFGAVCMPLGLWYSVRNLILFGQPLGYVVRFADDSWLYCGDQSPVCRFLSFPLGQLFNPLYCRSGEDCNIWLYILKSSLFGEYSFDNNSWAAAVLIVLNLLLILISVAAMIYVMTRGKGVNGFVRFGLFGLWLVQMVAFFVFNLRYPFGCTMDFRYILPTTIVGAIYIGIALDRLKAKNKTVANGFFYIGVTAVALFGLASVLFYAA